METFIAIIVITIVLITLFQLYSTKSGTKSSKNTIKKPSYEAYQNYAQRIVSQNEKTLKINISEHIEDLLIKYRVSVYKDESGKIRYNIFRKECDDFTRDLLNTDTIKTSIQTFISEINNEYPDLISRPHTHKYLYDKIGMLCKDLIVNDVNSYLKEYSLDNFEISTKKKPNQTQNPEADLIKCPICGSTQITANKKGFGAGKAAAGVLLTGGIGVLGGFIGSNKIIITCLKCGHKWRP